MSLNGTNTQGNWTFNLTTSAEMVQNQTLERSSLELFNEKYLGVHGYLILVVCTLGTMGILANLLNIYVMNHKKIFSSTHAILSGLAFSDMLMIVFYVPFAVNRFILVGQPLSVKNSYSWMMFYLFSWNFFLVSNTISNWLTIVLAIWRLLVIQFPTSSRKWCNKKRAGWAIGCTYLFSVLIWIPLYLTLTIKPGLPDPSTGKVSHYVVSYTPFVTKKNHKLLSNMIFLIFTVFTKLLPCIGVIGLSVALLFVLRKASQMRRSLSERSKYRMDRSLRQVNSMVLVVLVLYIVSEFPCALLALVNLIIGEPFSSKVYNNLREFFDFLSFTNNAGNFLIYICMSQQFRKTIVEIFTFKACAKKSDADKTKISTLSISLSQR